MCHEDIRTRLSDALNDAFRGTGNWAYIVAVFGDDSSGEVVYSCNSDLKKAAYTVSKTGCKIDTAGAVDVLPFTTYEIQAADLTEAGARNSRRDLAQLQTIHDTAAVLGANCSMAESRATGAGNNGGTGRNASTGAGRSFGNREVGHANGSGTAGVQQTAGRASTVGNGSTVAGREGAQRGREGLETSQTECIQLVESASTLENIILREARADYEIKLIAPGKGATAFYPAEVLKRDGPKVFTKETHVYLNHPTALEESQRPEGDVKNLAGVLTSDAVYHESHAKGPGLYARMKVFADHAQIVEEKAAHVGMSIRASGVREAGAMREGLPVLKELVAAESVDVVTHAGAGGMILTEAARTANPLQESATMDQAEINKLIEAGVKAATAPLLTNQTVLLERAIRGDAREAATSILKGITLPDVSKARVIEASLRSIPKTEAGELDSVKFAEVVNREAKSEGEYVAGLTGSGQVRGMGSATVTQTPEEKARAVEAAKTSVDDAIKVYEGLGMSRKAAEFAAKRDFEEVAA